MIGQLKIKNRRDLARFGFEMSLGWHDDVIKWKHFPRYWPFVRGIHRSPVISPHKGQWCGALIFTLICARINGWVNNREAGDLRRYRGHYDVIVMGVLYHRVPETSTLPKYIQDPYLVLSMPAASPAPDGARRRAATLRSKRMFSSMSISLWWTCLRHSKCMDHFVQTPSQWKMMLPCNAVFQFAGRVRKIIIEKKTDEIRRNLAALWMLRVDEIPCHVTSFDVFFGLCLKKKTVE